MPPKKIVTNGDASDAGEGKFKWEGPNDMKLLLLIQGRYCKVEEYEQLSSAFPGTTPGSIRNRISALRIKQRDLYESLGWDVPEGGAGHGKTKGKKRGASEGASEPNTPVKKARATPKKGKKEVVKKEESEEESVGVKDEIDGEEA